MVHIHTCEDSIAKPTKCCLKRGGEKEKGNGNIMEVGELVQDLLHACMELSQ
jgi:hypothetical protein